MRYTISKDDKILDEARKRGMEMIEKGALISPSNIPISLRKDFEIDDIESEEERLFQKQIITYERGEYLEEKANRIEAAVKAGKIKDGLFDLDAMRKEAISLKEYNIPKDIMEMDDDTLDKKYYRGLDLVHMDSKSRHIALAKIAEIKGKEELAEINAILNSIKRGDISISQCGDLTEQAKDATILTLGMPSEEMLDWTEEEIQNKLIEYGIEQPNKEDPDLDSR